MLLLSFLCWVLVACFVMFRVICLFNFVNCHRCWDSYTESGCVCIIVCKSFLCVVCVLWMMCLTITPCFCSSILLWLVVGQSKASWNIEAVEANVSRLRNISTPVSTVTPSGHFQVLLWNNVDKETVKRIDKL